MPTFTGAFLRPGDAGFADAATARIFNARRPIRRPAAVLRAADAADVVAGVRLAAAAGWQVAVRSGGHSWPAWSLRDGSLLIDLAMLAGVSYCPTDAIATVGPAARGGLDLDPRLAEHGRFFSVGHSPTVGMGGFLLQGGIGWNCRGWGWAAEAVESIDVVTAAGELVRCSDRENADLFWAARGSGPGFFGVVTEFRLRTRPRFRELTRSTFSYPATLAAEVLTWYHTVRADLPPTVELAAVGCVSPGSDSPVVVIDAVSFDGGEAALAALGSCPVVDRALVARVAQPVTLADLNAEQLRANPEQHRYFADNAFLTGSAADLVAALVPAFTELPTAESYVVLGDFTPQLARDRPEMAVSIGTDLYFAAYLVGATPRTDVRCRSWLADTMRRIAPHSAGCYLGDADLTARPDRVLSDTAWAKYERIRAVRDPGGRFAGFLGSPEQ